MLFVVDFVYFFAQKLWDSFLSGVLLVTFAYLRVQRVESIIPRENTIHRPSLWKLFTMKASVNCSSNLIH